MMGPGQKFFDQGQVESAICGLGLENFPYKNVKFFNFSFRIKKSLQVGSKSARVKGRSASYLLWVKSKLGSDPGRNPEVLI